MDINALESQNIVFILVSFIHQETDRCFKSFLKALSAPGAFNYQQHSEKKTLFLVVLSVSCSTHPKRVHRSSQLLKRHGELSRQLYGCFYDSI